MRKLFILALAIPTCYLGISPFESVISFSNNHNVFDDRAYFWKGDLRPDTFNIKESNVADVKLNKEYFKNSKWVGDKVGVLRTNIFTSDGFVRDGTIQIFSDEYSNNVDRADGQKMINPGINLSVIVGNKLLAVERKQPINQTDTIFFSLTGTTTGKYSLGFNATDMSVPDLVAWLEDGFTKVRSPINLEGVTNIPFEVTSDAGSKISDRFMIVFAKAEKGPLPVTFIRVDAIKVNGTVNVKWKVANEINLKNYVVMRSSDGMNFNDIGSVEAIGGFDYTLLDTKPMNGYNYYRIRSADRDGSIGYSEIVKIWMGELRPALTVFPNPITNGVLNLRVDNSSSGKYQIKLFSPAGQALLKKSFDYNGGSYVEKIRWEYKLTRGVYQLEVIQPDGRLKVIKILYLPEY